MTTTRALNPYLDRLLELPFIVAVNATAQKNARADVILDIDTPGGQFIVDLEVKSSHLSYANVDRTILIHAGVGRQWLLAAPYIGAPMAKYLRERSVNYIDLSGNCQIRLGTNHIAWIEGRKQTPKATSFAKVRIAGYQVLFAFLAKPSLVGEPIRSVAQIAGVSRQAVLAMRNRLLREEMLLKSKNRIHWDTERTDALLDEWLRGYKEVVRPDLVLGRYSTPYKTPDVLEPRIEAILDDAGEWYYGGSAAGYRIQPYFRGDLTIVHANHSPAPELLRNLKAIPDRKGTLTFLGLPGPIFKEGVLPKTVHPLLVYSEMVLGGEREREAAIEILNKYKIDRAV